MGSSSRTFELLDILESIFRCLKFGVVLARPWVLNTLKRHKSFRFYWVELCCSRRSKLSDMQVSCLCQGRFHIILAGSRVVLRLNLKCLVVGFRSHRELIRSFSNKLWSIVRSGPWDSSVSLMPSLWKHFSVRLSRSSE